MSRCLPDVLQAIEHEEDLRSADCFEPPKSLTLKPEFSDAMASSASNAISDSTGDPSVREILEVGVSDKWESSIPPGTRSKIVIDTKELVLKYPEDKAFIFQGGGRWELSKGTIALYVRDRRPHVNFALVASVSAFDHATVFDTDLVLTEEIKKQLPAPAADLCVLYDWGGIGEAKAREIACAHPEVAHTIKVIRGIEDLQSSTPGSKQTGVLVKAKLSLVDWSSSPSSLLKRLSDIDQVTGSGGISTIELSCFITKVYAPYAKPLRSITFAAQINALPVLDCVALEDITASLSIVQSDRDSPQASSPSAILKLTGRLVMGTFDTNNPWSSTGTLVIDKAKQKAELIVVPTSQEQAMAQLGKIKLGNIDFRVIYTFGGERVGLKVNLSLDVTLGTIVVRGSVMFNRASSSYLSFKVPGTFNINDIARFVVGLTPKLPDDILRISFTDLFFSYSWNTTTLARRFEEEIETGLTVRGQVKAFDRDFNALLKLVPSGQDKGIVASVRLGRPVNLVIFTLHGKKNATIGPLITYDGRQATTQGSTIDCGLLIFGKTIDDVQMRSGPSEAKDKAPCFQVKVNIKSDKVPGGNVPITLEIVTVNDRTHIRLFGLDLTEIVDAFNAKKIWDKLRDITKKDPCKEIDIPDIMEHKFRPKISWAEKQPEQEVGKPLRCSFDVAITWYIKVLNEKVVDIIMDPFTLTMNVPNTLEDVWEEIRLALANSIEQMAQNLLDNVGKFSLILTFLYVKHKLEKWLNDALRAWLCRHPKAPVPKPIDEPAPPPPPPPPENPVPGPPPPPSPPPPPHPPIRVPEPPCPIEEFIGLVRRFTPHQVAIDPRYPKTFGL